MGGKHSLGDMTLSDAGDAYVSDGLGSVYEVDHEQDRIELLFAPGTFRSPWTPVRTNRFRTVDTVPKWIVRAQKLHFVPGYQEILVSPMNRA